MYYNISREIRRFDLLFRASLFPRNSGITAKIDGITRLPCYTTAAVTAKAVIYNLLSLVCTGFTKKLSIISSIDVKRLLRTTAVFVFFNRKKKGRFCVAKNFSASIINK